MCEDQFEKFAKNNNGKAVGSGADGFLFYPNSLYRHSYSFYGLFLLSEKLWKIECYLPLFAGTFNSEIFPKIPQLGCGIFVFAQNKNPGKLFHIIEFDIRTRCSYFAFAFSAAFFEQILCTIRESAGQAAVTNFTADELFIIRSGSLGIQLEGVLPFSSQSRVKTAGCSRHQLQPRF